MEENLYSGFSELPRKRCCGWRTQLLLVGLVTASLWAALLSLLLLWHWDTLQNLKQLEETAAQNVSQISKDLQRYQHIKMDQKSQAAQILQNMEELQAEQKRMKSQDSELSWNLDGLLADLNNLKSQGLNQRREASDMLERLKEEVARLRIELKLSQGTTCKMCPKMWVYFQQKCYYFGEGAKKWLHAQYACEAMGGRLVSIHSREEQDFLIKRADWKGSWIGLQDLDREGQFTWMDGSPVSYSNWYPGEPNNQDQGENCVMMRGSGQWNDAACQSRLDAWVCEQLATCGLPATLVPVEPLGTAPSPEP
ncbi:low affinity immunoglobulin epsilon Fc receptor [Otolemur garnettii]|uniref:Fc epsilon receptor II n=1 Tax=Otolemur garnettii TaxID=30611 RepID=H0X786_OTOGA|nr:low affinity immunoglobulin epsilon Fc receptor [Otolemur garnettii]